MLPPALQSHNAIAPWIIKVLGAASIVRGVPRPADSRRLDLAVRQAAPNGDPGPRMDVDSHSPDVGSVPAPSVQ